MEKTYENLLQVINEKLTPDESYELSNIIGCPSQELKDEFSNALMKKSYEKRKDVEIQSRLGFSKKDLVGLKLKDLKAKFPTLKIRILGINGEGFAGTCDYDMSRLNVTLENVEVKSSKVEKIRNHEFTVNEYCNEDEGLITDCDFG